MLALDFGTSSIKVASDTEKIVLLNLGYTVNFEVAELTKLWQELREKFGEFSELRVTGGRSVLLPGEFEGTSIQVVNEFEAIAKGALYLGKLPEALIVNLGSGVSLTYAKQVEEQLTYTHLGGSAFGGVTLQALGKLILQIKDLNKLAALASKGDWTKADLTIGEVTGRQISENLPLDKSAVHLAKLLDKKTKFKQADLAAALYNLLATNLITLIVPHARQTLTNKILLAGGLAKSELLVKLLKSFEADTNLQFQTLPNPEFVTSLGAVL